MDTGAPSAAGPCVRGDVAWEFLRRDAGYRRAWWSACHGANCPTPSREVFGDFGLRLPADPHLDATAAGVLWRSEIAPAVVVELEAAPHGIPGAVDLNAVSWWRYRDGAVTHLRAPLGLQLEIRAHDLQAPLALVVPLGRDFAIRMRTMVQLQRVLASRAAVNDFTSQQLRRLRRAVWTLDAAEAGLSHREMAAGLFGAAALEREPWKTSSLRDTTVRLVRLGVAMKQGGYRRLLLTRPR